MSIKFKAIQRKNPRDFSAAPKYYAIAISDELVGLDRISEIVTDGSTVRPNDMYAVIIGVVNALKGELRAGRSVKIDTFGVISTHISSKPAETAEEVTIDSIKSTRLRYRSSPELKKMLSTLSFTKITDKK